LFLRILIKLNPEILKSLLVIIVLMVVVPCSLCLGQRERDSLTALIQLDRRDTTHVKALIELSILTADDFGQSKQYGKQAVDLAIDSRDEKSLLSAYVNMLKLYRGARVNDTALHFANLSQELAFKLADANSIAEIKLDAGNVHLNSHNYLKALSEFISAARILDSLGVNPKGQMTAYVNIGNVEVLLGNYEKALEYISKGLTIAQEIHSERGIAYSYKTLGRIYRHLKKLDLSESAYKQALDSYKKMDDQYMVSELHQNLGTVYFDRNDFVSAIKYYEISLTVAKTISSTSQIPYYYAALGASWNALRNFPKAKAYFDSTLRLARGTNPYLVMDSYENLAQIAETQGNHKQSLFYFKLFTSLSDSLKAVENKSEAEEIEAKYQNTAKQNEIELLKKDSELQQAKLKRQQANIVAASIVLVSITIIGFLLINRYRVMNRIRRQLEMEQMRQNISRDLHDDIGSALSSINILSRVAQNEKEGDVQNYLQRIGDQSARMMENMGDMIWSINPQNDSMEQVIVRMREFATEMLDARNIEVEFLEQIPGETTINSEKRKNLFLIFKEAINNVSKYSQAKHVAIRLFQEDHNLALWIKDDGNGFDEGNVKTGNGLRNFHERAKAIGGVISVKSKVGEGTEVKLRFAIA
jgi:two-component system, NarL family, sensor histidine kinase UhpB